jgi:hypothetical protein
VVLTDEDIKHINKINAINIKRHVEMTEGIIAARFAELVKKKSKPFNWD